MICRLNVVGDKSSVVLSNGYDGHLSPKFHWLQFGHSFTNTTCSVNQFYNCAFDYVRFVAIIFGIIMKIYKYYYGCIYLLSFNILLYNQALGKYTKYHISPNFTLLYALHKYMQLPQMSFLSSAV